jgi:hypothetical protein
MLKPRPFFRPTSPKNCTVEFTLPVEVVRKLQRLAGRGRQSEKGLCQNVLKAFTDTIFTGASFQQFRALVNAKVTNPKHPVLWDDDELLILELAESFRRKQPLSRRLAKAPKLLQALAWEWAKTKPEKFWVRA